MPQRKNDEKTASERLHQFRDKILALWEEQVRESVEPAKSQEKPALRNSLPEVIDGMVKTLSAPDPQEVMAAEQRRLAVGHGKHRAANPDYSLDQVINEYHILRKVLFDVIESGGYQLSRQERDLIWDVLFISIKNASAEFKEMRDKQRVKLEHQLDEANISLKEALGEKSSEAFIKGQLLETIFKRVEDYALFALDAEGKVATWAAGAQKMKGYSEADVIGNFYGMLYPKEGRLRNEPGKHLEIARNEGRFRGEGLRQRKNGEFFLADVFITPMYDGGELIGYFKIVSDLTERNRVIQERDLTRTQVESLEIESDLRERFVFSLTHDMKNPLSSAKAYSELIAKKKCEVDQHRELAQRSGQILDRIDGMITDLLDASRIQAGQPFSLNIETYDFGEELDTVLAELGTVYENRLVADAPKSLSVSWDCHALRRVLENLIINAVKYGDPLTPVTISANEVEDRVLVKVHNEGSAISSEDQESLFALFHRTESARKGQKKGWGLGLTLVRGIVEAHGGVVKVRSLPKEGTTFTLDLPKDAPQKRARAS